MLTQEVNMNMSAAQPIIKIPPLESEMYNTKIILVDDFFDQTALDIIFNENDWSRGIDAQLHSPTSKLDKDYRTAKCNFLDIKTSGGMYVLNLMISKVNTINKTSFMYDIDSIYDLPNLLTYNAPTNGNSPAGHYEWHVDCIHSIPRKLSMTVTLSHSNEYEGGELQTFQDGPQTIEQKFNRAIIFPSFVSHRVTRVTKGSRKSFVQWFNGPAFK